MAIIQDLELNDSDVIRLHGNADSYSLESFLGSTAIFYNSEGQTSELIGIVQNVADLDIFGSAFEFTAV